MNVVDVDLSLLRNPVSLLVVYYLEHMVPECFCGVFWVDNDTFSIRLVKINLRGLCLKMIFIKRGLRLDLSNLFDLKPERVE